MNNKMEFNQEELDKNPANGEELDEQQRVDSSEIDTSFETYSMKLEEILRNENNSENILKQAAENLQIYKQTLTDQSETLNEIQDKNQYISVKIKYENQLRDKLVKRIIQTHDELKTVTSSTNFGKSTITFCENTKEKINQGKQQLLDRISFNKEKDDLKYEQLIHQNDLLSEQLRNEKLNMIKFENEFKTEMDELDNKIKSKKENINNLKMTVRELNIQNEANEKRNNAVVSEIDLISKKIDFADFKLNTLEETIKENKMEYGEKIKKLNGSIQINNNCINNLEKNIDVTKKEINNGHEMLNKTNNNKSELNQKLSEIELKHNSNNEEIEKFKTVHELKMNEYNAKMNALKQEIKMKQKEIFEMKIKNLNIKEDHHALVNQIMFLKSNNNQLGRFILKLKKELKEKHNILNENEKNFKNTISKKEKNLNLEIDKLNDILESENQEAKTKIREFKQKIEEELQRAQEENDSKIKILEEQTSIYLQETGRVHKDNEEKPKHEQEKLMEMDNHLKLKISIFKTKKQNLEKKLAARIKEREKIWEKKEMELQEQREEEFLEVAEQEMSNVVDVVSLVSPAVAKGQVRVSDKKMKLIKEELPNLETPDSKYTSSSTLFSDSDSSICSLDSTSIQKNELHEQKRPRQSLDEVFDSLREEQTPEITTKKPKI